MISLRTVTKWRNVMAPGFGFDTLGMLSDFVSMRRIRCSTTAVSWPATQFACIAMVDVAVMRFVLPDK